MKVAIIGAGRMGRRYIQVVREMGLDLAGLCDSNPESLALAVKEQGVLPQLHYSNARMLLQEQKPECVIIATTAPTHCEYTCLAARHNAKYILCEKPMAVSLNECDKMISSCNETGAKLAINHQMRFMEQNIEPKKLLLSEAFGGLTSVTVITGNMGLAMNGIHYFEMFRFLTEEYPVEATAWFSNTDVPNWRGAQFKDCAGSIRLVTASGKRLYMESGDDQGHGLLVIYAGKYGQLIVDQLAGIMRWSVRNEEHRSSSTSRYDMPWGEFTQKIAPTDALTPTKSVLKALLEKGDYPTAEQGKAGIAALVAAYVSNENGHTAVGIDGNLPSSRVFPWA